ncbi:SMC-Scp complex subunit ScpB [Xiamenia xianingshaonis]|uniref:SMC-Scp complex subunit ScpB n=1 Tax=Xiamenia xianingshaonis TaxID=2682776 RepID=A0A9E6SUT8_9ACTN|nr:SMC-Scp complex subunit ScpB [Xiamenia xianingshaonis]NHM14384.1 SMC-Scp complex subunit ScpB [Xiamenia xianingshaonis]QTU84861.1 SMC-Scp complex subunit ScpB [Xiamenia xianingshaonis]
MSETERDDAPSFSFGSEAGRTPNLPGALEALLFVTDEPVSTSVLATMCGAKPTEVQRALADVQARLEERCSGLVLREVAGGWRLFSNPAYHDLIEAYVLSWDTRKLSAAAMETLAVVAYAQPVTRGAIASVRGVNSDSSLHSLVEKGLVREVGVADAPGNPALYGTSRTFLEKFGLRSPADLPPLADYAPDEETEALIRERLSASRSEVVDGEEALAELLADEGVAAAAATLAEAPAASAVQPAASDAEEAPDQLLSALAGSLGLVEKIDFDSLVFETDDE